MTSQISDIVKVTSTIVPSGSARATLGKTLYVAEGDALDPVGVGKVKEYASLAGVGKDFETTDDVYLAAARYFAQVPYPNRFIVGRWTTADQAALVRGGAHSSLAALTAVSGGTFRVAGADFTGVDLTSGVSDLAAVAAAIQTKLRTGTGAVFTGATVTHDGSRFVVSFGGAADNGTLFAAHSQGSGTDLSSLLGLSSEAGATYHPGGMTETISAALDAIQAVNDTFYFLTLNPARNGTQAILDASAWIAAQDAIFVAESNESAAVFTNDAASFAARLSAVQSERTALIWSAHSDYKAVSIAARLSSVDFSQPGSLITLAYKSLPGCAVDALDATQRAELERKNILYYRAVLGKNVVIGGTTLKPRTWIDVRYWVDWIENAIQTEVFNLLSSSRRIPQTQSGIVALRDAITNVCEEGVRNGGIALGEVSAAMAARIRDVIGGDFDGILPNGYYIYIAPLAQQAQSARDARDAPAISVFMKGSGAVHYVDIDLTFEN